MSAINWDQGLWPANCGNCGAGFDCLLQTHLELCGGCQKHFADCTFCGVQYARLADGIPVVCDDCRKQQFADCTSCGGYYDRLADQHPTRCGACQIMFPAASTIVAPAALAAPQAAAPPPPEQQEERPDRAHYVHCKLCSRHFPPNKNNNGIHCTVCCNKEAEKGNDLFASLNMPPSVKAAENLKKARAQRQQATSAPGVSVAAATRAMLTYNRSGYPGLGGGM